MTMRIGEVVDGIGHQSQNAVTMYEAVINNTVTAFGQDLFVTIPSIDQGRSTKGPLRWNPISGPGGISIYPTKGDIASVVRTQEGYYWLNSFIPASYPAAPASLIRTFIVPLGTSVLSLGAFDGNNISGIRIVAQLRMAAAVSALLYLKPNGLATINGQVQSFRYYWPAAGPVGTQNIFGNDAAPQPGFALATMDFGVAAMGIWIDGTLFTPGPSSPPMYRRYSGRYSNNDYQVNVNNTVEGLIYSNWQDTTTPITSLALVTNVGTFSGRVTVEIIP